MSDTTLSSDSLSNNTSGDSLLSRVLGNPRGTFTPITVAQRESGASLAPTNAIVSRVLRNGNISEVKNIPPVDGIRTKPETLRKKAEEEALLRRNAAVGAAATKEGYDFKEEGGVITVTIPPRIQDILDDYEKTQGKIKALIAENKDLQEQIVKMSGEITAYEEEIKNLKEQVVTPLTETKTPEEPHADTLPPTPSKPSILRPRFKIQKETASPIVSEATKPLITSSISNPLTPSPVQSLQSDATLPNIEEVRPVAEQVLEIHDTPSIETTPLITEASTPEPELQTLEAKPTNVIDTFVADIEARSKRPQEIVPPSQKVAQEPAQEPVAVVEPVLQEVDPTLLESEPLRENPEEVDPATIRKTVNAILQNIIANANKEGKNSSSSLLSAIPN